MRRRSEKTWIALLNPTSELLTLNYLSEDSLESPLTELGLLEKGTGNTIQLVETERYNLPYGLFILSIYAFWKNWVLLQVHYLLKIYWHNPTHLDAYLR